MSTYQTPAQFLQAKQGIVDAMAGYRGVVQARDHLNVLYDAHNLHTRNLVASTVHYYSSDLERKIERCRYKKMIAGVIPADSDLIQKRQAKTNKYTDNKINAELAATLYTPEWSRGSYGELIHKQPDTDAKYINYQWVRKHDYGIFTRIFMDAHWAILSEYRSILHDLDTIPDEHGSWDEKRRGNQISIDLYGADLSQNLYVIQVRHAFRVRASHYLQTHKSYFLIGRNENGNAFAHCIGANKIRSAINREGDIVDPKTAVTAALEWIWNTDRIDDIIRHGDVALLPVGCTPNAPILQGKKTYYPIDSHRLQATELRQNGKLFAKNPKLHHTKNQHADVKYRGWCQVIIGRREESWSFANESVD